MSGQNETRENMNEMINEPVETADTASSNGGSTGKHRRKKMSKQMSMSIIMVIVSLVILSISTYAWFLITNSPKAQNITLTADTLGDLKIADITAEDTPDTYGDSIDLTDTTGMKSYLSPVTTKDGLTFFSPEYSEGNVVGLNEETDETRLHTKYVYEKTFFLRAGKEKSEVDQNKAKNFDIYLVGTTTDSSNGCYMRQKNTSGTDGSEITAANSLRVSLTFEGGITGETVTVIYEPNVDKDNGGVAGTNMAFYRYVGADKDEYGAYSTIQQNYDKSFVPNSNVASRSVALDTIKEGEDIKVTMRIWLEGMDKDCMNDIAADQIIGQLQFISEENLNQFETGETETETTNGN